MSDADSTPFHPVLGTANSLLGGSENHTPNFPSFREPLVWHDTQPRLDDKTSH